MGRRYTCAFEFLRANLYFRHTMIVLEFREFAHIDSRICGLHRPEQSSIEANTLFAPDLIRRHPRPH